jgi:acetyltransferase-like isoleucine patch superfamily enzyme
MKQAVNEALESLAAAFVLPWRGCHLVYRVVAGKDRACEALSQRASRWPGAGGNYLRRALLRGVLEHVGRDVTVSFGTLFSKPSARLGDGVYVGPYCMLGKVIIGRDTLLADHVTILSGAAQHGLARLDVPVRQQPGTFEMLEVGQDCWIGAGAIVLANVGDHCVVAAGSVVTHPVEEWKIVAGVPARVIGDRRDKAVEGAGATGRDHTNARGEAE